MTDEPVTSKKTIIMYPAAVPPRDNPYVPTLVDALRTHGVKTYGLRAAGGRSSPDVLHVHWLERVFHTRLSSRFSWVARWYAERLVRTAEAVRSRGGRVCWTAHNLSPHDGLSEARRAIWNAAHARFFPTVTDVFLLSSDARAQVVESIPALAGARFHVVLHHHYRDFFNEHEKSDHIRSEYGIPQGDDIFSVIGFLKPYKQVEKIVEAFVDADLPASWLLVAGKCHADYRAVIAEKAKNHPRVVLIFETVTHEKLSDIIRSSIACVFNFKSVFNSGSVMTALSLDTAVIAPRFGSIDEIADIVGSDWVCQFEGPISVEVLRQSLSILRNRPSGAPDLAAFEPRAVAGRHLPGYGLAPLDIGET